jgi:hypothetical protein
MGINHRKQKTLHLIDFLNLHINPRSSITTGHRYRNFDLLIEQGEQLDQSLYFVKPFQTIPKK